MCLITSIFQYFLLRLEIEREKAPLLQAMLKMQQNYAQHLARRERLFTEVPAMMKQSEKM